MLIYKNFAQKPILGKCQGIHFDSNRRSSLGYHYVNTCQRNIGFEEKSLHYFWLKTSCLYPYDLFVTLCEFAHGKYRQVLGYHTNDFEVTTKE